MSSLSYLLGTLMAKIQSQPICEKANVVETRAFSQDQFFFKIRAELKRGNSFQVRIYYNRGHIDYAYQLFSQIPLLRWDNKEEFDHLDTYPHHQHDEHGGIKPSPLTGDPEKDIEAVFHEIVDFKQVNEK